MPMVWYSGLNEETVMKSIKYNESNIKKSPVAKNATSRTLEIVGDEISLTMDIVKNNKTELFRFDLTDSFLNEYWEMNLSREKLKGLAEFILNYLENN